MSLALFITRHRDGIVDRAARALFIAAMSVSALVYVLALQYLLAFKLDWFPINGYEGGWAAVKYLALPWLIQLLLLMGPDIRLYRTLFLADINADWVRTARSKGAGEGRVLFRHVLPNAWIPIITQNVTTIPFLILGSFLMERFFSIPGIGNLTIDALSRGDLPDPEGRDRAGRAGAGAVQPDQRPAVRGRRSARAAVMSAMPSTRTPSPARRPPRRWSRCGAGRTSAPA